MLLPIILISILVAWNIVTFATYGIDKLKAKRSKRRISEATLIKIAFLLGGFGAFCGMYVFRHKTDHRKFFLLVPLACFINAIIIAGAIWAYFIF